MREILFRGKEITTAKWVYGGYYGDSKRAWIRSVVSTEYGREILQHEVDPSTVGQYAGLTDKNGKRIFEGDILERRILPTKRIAIRFRIAWVPVKACLSAIDIEGRSVTFISDYINSGYEIEIIGNVYDNPELLEVSHD